jgi:hypothetical protein
MNNREGSSTLRAVCWTEDLEGVRKRVRCKIIQYRFLHNKAAKAKIKKEKDKEE